MMSSHTKRNICEIFAICFSIVMWRAGQLGGRTWSELPPALPLCFSFRWLGHQHLRPSNRARWSFPEEALTTNRQHPFGSGGSCGIASYAQYICSGFNGSQKQRDLQFWRVDSPGRSRSVSLPIRLASLCRINHALIKIPRFQYLRSKNKSAAGRCDTNSSSGGTDASHRLRGEVRSERVALSGRKVELQSIESRAGDDQTQVARALAIWRWHMAGWLLLATAAHVPVLHVLPVQRTVAIATQSRSTCRSTYMY